MLANFACGSFATDRSSASAQRCPLLVRLCCKSRKLEGRDFLAKTRNGKQSPIRIISIALPKSPVSFARGDEVPHIFTRKPRLQPAEFLITSAKRLLQQNLPLSTFFADQHIISISSVQDRCC